MSYDIIVVGAGSNSLTTACYLAKAGLSVLVLEREEQCGGGVVSVSTAPGFTHDPHAMGYLVCQANPAIKNEELELRTRFGLEFALAESPFASLYPNGNGLISYTDVDRSLKEIAKFSEKDARAYAQLVEEAFELLPILLKSFFAPPMPYDGFMKLLAATDQGRKLKHEMEGSVIDFLNDRFESPEVKVHMAKWASELMSAPDLPGTGLTMYLILGIGHQVKMGTVVGGAQSLTNALIACLEHHGGELRTQTTVERLVVADGRCTGVVLDTGAVLTAKKAVVANIHPWDLGDMVEGVPADVVARAKATKLSEYGAINQQIALSEAPIWIGGDAYQASCMVECLSPNWEEFLHPFQAYRRNEFPIGHLGPLAGPQSNFDPTRAPPGQCALYLYSFAPLQIEGGWDAHRQAVGDAIFDWFASFTTNIDRSKILGRLIESPLEHHRHSRMMRNGDIMGIAMTADQLLGARPTKDLASYRVPGVEGLYLAGCTSHPGGTVTLGGRATAMKIYDDFGIDLSVGFIDW